MNYPPGVTDAHPYFNPPCCHACGAEGVAEGEECPDCGEYQPTDDELADEAADRAYERMRDGW